MLAGMPRPFLTAEWRYLAMLNYEVDPEVVRPLAPPGTEIDLWEGRTFVSVVGFRFLRTRVLGLSIPFHRDFDEVNLRFYIRRKAPEGWRRAVAFVREIVPRQTVATVARALYNEPYVALPMRHRVEMAGAEDGRTGEVSYEWRFRGRWHGLSVRTLGAPAPAAAGSEEEFITEHYWGYTPQRDGGCKEYRVEHPSWSVWQAGESRLECDVSALYGSRFAGPLAGRPRSAFVADGSQVTVYQGARLQL